MYFRYQNNISVKKAGVENNKKTKFSHNTRDIYIYPEKEREREGVQEFLEGLR